MTTTLNAPSNVRKRPSLSDQIERLDSLLDGLSEGLNEAVGDAVKSAVGAAVREAVQATLLEVLSSPQLLGSALAQHSPPAPPTQAEPVPQRPPRTGALQGAWGWVSGKAEQVQKGLSQAWAWCLKKLRQGWAGVSAFSLALSSMAGALAGCLWHARRTCAIALGVGLTVGVVGYLAGPFLAGVLCALSGTALTLAGSVLMPLWRVLAMDEQPR
jgi:hypothetical protein